MVVLYCNEQRSGANVSGTPTNDEELRQYLGDLSNSYNDELDYAINDNRDGYLSYGRSRFADAKDERRLVGWKSHITVPLEQVYKVAAVICLIARREIIQEVKFYTLESVKKAYPYICERLKRNPNFHGHLPPFDDVLVWFKHKEFTFYLYEHPKKDWCKILREIDTGLHAMGIPVPVLSEIPEACKKIQGLDYSSFRCDQRKISKALSRVCYWDETLIGQEEYRARMEAIYVDEETAVKINPSMPDNPFDLSRPSFMWRIIYTAQALRSTTTSDITPTSDLFP